MAQIRRNSARQGLCSPPKPVCMAYHTRLPWGIYAGHHGDCMPSPDAAIGLSNNRRPRALVLQGGHNMWFRPHRFSLLLVQAAAKETIRTRMLGVPARLANALHQGKSKNGNTKNLVAHFDAIPHATTARLPLHLHTDPCHIQSQVENDGQTNAGLSFVWSNQHIAGYWEMERPLALQVHSAVQIRDPPLRTTLRASLIRHRVAPALGTGCVRPVHDDAEYRCLAVGGRGCDGVAFRALTQTLLFGNAIPGGRQAVWRRGCTPMPFQSTLMPMPRQHP